MNEKCINLSEQRYTVIKLTPPESKRLDEYVNMCRTLSIVNDKFNKTTILRKQHFNKAIEEHNGHSNSLHELYFTLVKSHHVYLYVTLYNSYSFFQLHTHFQNSLHLLQK